MRKRSVLNPCSGRMVDAPQDKESPAATVLKTQEITMSYNSTSTDPFVARAPFTGASNFAAAMKRLIRVTVTRWQKRRTARALDRLSDWMLQDIGVTRGEIPRLVDEIFADDIRPASLLSPYIPATRRLEPKQG